MMFAFAGLFAGDVVVAQAAATEQAAPASAQAAPPAVSDVVVQADRPAAVERIDRNVYDLKTDPQAQTAPLIDVLGKLPSVSVTPTGELRLLGVGGVTVLIDGKPAANASQKLSTLRGADVDQVEVMTNPSAQYGPQGTAGIINIVTRKHHRDGWSGSATASGESDSDVTANLSPNLVRGGWTLSGALDLKRDRQTSTHRAVRDILDAAGATSETRTDDSEISNVNDQASLELKLAYRPSERHRLQVSAEVARGDGDGRTIRDVSSTAPTFGDYIERQDGASSFSTTGFGANYEWTGGREGENLKLDASHDRLRWPLTNATTTGTGAFSTRWSPRNDDTTLKADYERPLGGKAILTSGLSWAREDHDLENILEILAGNPIPSGGYTRQLDSRRDLLSVYGTLQAKVGAWTLLPGLRFENEDLSVRSASNARSSHENGWFPSLHATRILPGKVSLRLSYSKRIQRLDPTTLDTTVLYFSANDASVGNPDLKPALTHAYEARFSGKIASQSIELTLYDRVSEDIWSNFTRLTADGIFLSTTINGGRGERRGGELSLRGPLPGPLAERFKYALTANLFVRSNPVLEDGIRRDYQETSYSGNAQLDYKGAARPDRDAQQVQLSLRYYGPGQALQSRTGAFARADLTWRRPLTSRIASVLVVQDLLGASRWNRRARGDDFNEVTTARVNVPRLKWSLTYQLGGKS